MSSLLSTVVIPRGVRSEFLGSCLQLLVTPDGLGVESGLSQWPSQLLVWPVVTCTGVAILVEAIPAGGHTLPMPHQQGRLARGALQATGTRGTLRLAGCSGQGWEKEKGSSN